MGDKGRLVDGDGTGVKAETLPEMCMPASAADADAELEPEGRTRSKPDPEPEAKVKEEEEPVAVAAPPVAAAVVEPQVVAESEASEAVGESPP